MSSTLLQSKIAIPYAKAVFDFSIERNIMHQITADFQNLETFLHESPILMNYLTNPALAREIKQQILISTLRAQVNSETFKFLMVLIIRDRINLLLPIIDNYLKLVYETASIKIVEVSTPSGLTNLQEETIVKKLKKLTNAREIRLIVNQDPDLIGGLLIKTESKVLDFTVKNQLQQLAKHLDTSLDI